ncbi:MAG: hypothetical protein QGG71_15290 [Pirellulaceae bacterium]|nr:hypothetical protein [Pirellulaceae bacterium]
MKRGGTSSFEVDATATSRLIDIDEVDQFARIADISPRDITEEVLRGIAGLHEVRELEVLIREIIADPTETPHGPTEIADILTTQIHVAGQRCVAGFVLKGRSFGKVRSKDVTHQFAKLRTIEGLQLMVFAAVGSIQDDAQRDFLQTAKDAQCNYLVMNVLDLARLLIAYGKVCPEDGLPYDKGGKCPNDHEVADS